MRRWSELAERVAATTRTSEKTALLADYLTDLSPTSCRSRPCSSPAGRSPRPTSGRPGWAGRRSGRPSQTSPASPRSALAEAYDRSSDLGMAVADVLSGAGHAPDPAVSPTLTDVAAAYAAIEAASGPAAKSAIMRDLLARADPLTAKYIVKVLGGELRIGLREGLVEAAIAKAFDRHARRREVGRDADRRRRGAGDARPRGPARGREPGDLPPDQVHARLAGRGRRRDPEAARAGGLGRGQVRRDPGPAPQARPRGPPLQPRPPRRQHAVPGGRRGRGRSLLGRDPRRRDPGVPGRRRAAVHLAPGAARPEVAVGRDPRGDPGDLRRVRRARASAARTAGSTRCCASRSTSGDGGSTTLDLPPADDGGRFARSHLDPGRHDRRPRGRVRGGPRPAQRGPDGQGSPERLLAGAARARLAEDEEGPRDDRLRRRRRRGRPRQAPRRAERLHVRRPRHRERPAGQHRQGVQRPDRRRDRRDDARGSRRTRSPGSAATARSSRRSSSRSRSTSSSARTATSPGSRCGSRGSPRSGRTSRPTRSTRSRPSARCTRTSSTAASTW